MRALDVIKWMKKKKKIGMKNKNGNMMERR